MSVTVYTHTSIHELKTISHMFSRCAHTHTHTRVKNYLSHGLSLFTHTNMLLHFCFINDLLDFGTMLVLRMTRLSAPEFYSLLLN